MNDLVLYGSHKFGLQDILIQDFGPCYADERSSYLVQYRHKKAAAEINENKQVTEHGYSNRASEEVLSEELLGPCVDATEEDYWDFVDRGGLESQDFGIGTGYNNCDI